MRLFQFASYLPMLAAINTSERSLFHRIFADSSGPASYARSPSAPDYRKLRKARYRHAHQGNRERERHLRQMGAGQLDFSASDPTIWRHRPYAPNFRSLMKHMKRRSRLQCSPFFLGLLSAARQATDDKAECDRRFYHVH